MENMTSGGLSVKVGPWGGLCGKHPWHFHPDDDSRLIGIVVKSDSQCVHSIQFLYVDSTGDPHLSPIFGGAGGDKTETILFPDEALVWIGGTFGYSYPPYVVMTSLSFRTSLNKYECGPGGGTPFTLPLQEGKVVGFFGKYGDRLDSFGVTIKGVPDN